MQNPNKLVRYYGMPFGRFTAFHVGAVLLPGLFVTLSVGIP